MRRKRVIIGKLGETGAKGPRDQGMKDLSQGWWGCLEAEGLDRGKAAGLAE